MKTILIAATLVAAASPAVAVTNLVTNGGFETSTYTANHEFDGPYAGAYGSNTVNSWTSTGYNILFIGGTQSTVSAVNRFNAPLNDLYPSMNTLSADGGNFVALDGDSSVRGPLSQTIAGLTVGGSYTLSFYWGGAQLQSSQGATTDSIQVSFGGETFTTPVIANVTKGFTGWQTASFTFTPTTTSQILSFLSIGTPDGFPPVAVLDGVSLTENTGTVPEPASWALLMTGFAFVGYAARRRRAAIVTA